MVGSCLASVLDSKSTWSSMEGYLIAHTSRSETAVFGGAVSRGFADPKSNYCNVGRTCRVAALGLLVRGTGTPEMPPTCPIAAGQLYCARPRSATVAPERLGPFIF